MRGQGLSRYIWVLANEPGGLPQSSFDFVSPSGRWAFKILGIDPMGIAPKLRYLVIMFKQSRSSYYYVTEALAQLLQLEAPVQNLSSIRRPCVCLTIPVLDAALQAGYDDTEAYKKEISEWLLRLLINRTKARVVEQRLLLPVPQVSDCRKC